MLKQLPGFSPWIEWNNRDDDCPDDNTLTMFAYEDEDLEQVNKGYEKAGPSLSWKEIVHLHKRGLKNPAFYSFRLVDEHN